MVGFLPLGEVAGVVEPVPAFGAVDCLVPVAGNGGGDVMVLSALTESDRHLEVVNVGEIRVHQLMPEVGDGLHGALLAIQQLLDGVTAGGEEGPDQVAHIGAAVEGAAVLDHQLGEFQQGLHPVLPCDCFRVAVQEGQGLGIAGMGAHEGDLFPGDGLHIDHLAAVYVVMHELRMHLDELDPQGTAPGMAHQVELVLVEAFQQIPAQLVSVFDVGVDAGMVLFGEGIVGESRTPLIPDHQIEVPGKSRVVLFDKWQAGVSRPAMQIE